MNKKEIVGIGERRSGVSKTGKQYDFTPLYCIYEDAKVKGRVAEEIMFSHGGEVSLPNIQVGDVINVFYDKRGFIQHIEVVTKSSSSDKGLPKL